MRKFKYIICHQCEGHGTMENPAFENGFTQSEMAEWEPEMREKYFAGAFDVRCDVCAGDGKLSVPNVAAMSFQNDGFWQHGGVMSVFRLLMNGCPARNEQWGTEVGTVANSRW